MFGEKRLVKSVKVLLASIESINPIRKCPHITQSYACVLKIFVRPIDLSINLFIYLSIDLFIFIFWNMLNSKISKYVTLLFNAYKGIQWVSNQDTHQDLLHMPHPFLSGRLSLE